MELKKNIGNIRRLRRWSKGRST